MPRGTPVPLPQLRAGVGGTVPAAAAGGGSRGPPAPPPCPRLLHGRSRRRRRRRKAPVAVTVPPGRLVQAPSGTGQGSEGPAQPPPLAAAAGRAQGGPQSPVPQLLPVPPRGATPLAVAPGSNCRGPGIPRAAPGPPPQSQGPPNPGSTRSSCGGGPGWGRSSCSARPRGARGGEGPRGERGSRRVPVTVTVTAVAAHAQAGPRVSSDEPEPAGSRSAGGGGCGTHGRARRRHAVAHTRLTHTARSRESGTEALLPTVKLHLQKSATSGVLGAGGVRRVGLICASGNTQDLPPAPGAAPRPQGRDTGAPTPRPPGRLKCRDVKASTQGGRQCSQEICCSEGDPVLRGSSSPRRIRDSEEDPALQGSSSQRIKLSEEDPARREGSDTWRIQLGGGSNAGRRIQHSVESWCLEDPALGGSSHQRIQLLEHLALGGGSRSQRRIWLLEDLALGGGSSAPPLMFVQSPGPFFAPDVPGEPPVPDPLSAAAPRLEPPRPLFWGHNPVGSGLSFPNPGCPTDTQP
ncbi:uncharacterized protein LOC113959775 [Corapipo altera]|uniref:uncharacterized protein LOC113959775 n=1 Tax=Corapipo altera TaxID=415028 RepID=UPI000FD6300A|nr:uncharacterized protein LOC113959775 [Corapipo altera]